MPDELPEHLTKRGYVLADHELTDEEIRTTFGPLIDHFFGTEIPKDPEYLVDMLKSADTYLLEQEMWKARTRALTAEKEARRRCDIDNSNTELFCCTNSSVCGFGKCAYAKPENTMTTVVSPRRNKPRTRPRKNALEPQYYIEDAIETLARLQEKTRKSA